MTTLTWEERVELAQRFAPRLVLFPERSDLERPTIKGGTGDYHPRTIDLLVDYAKLYPGTLDLLLHLNFGPMFDYNQRTPATVKGLAASTSTSDQLRLIGPPLPKADAAWRKYFEILDAVDATGRSGRERYPVTTYAHVITRAEALDACARAKITVDPQHVGRPSFDPATAQPDDIALQYWFCYYFDDWYNVHEGDWEGITIFLKREGADWQPQGATYFAHENGSRRHWEDVQIVEGTHPLVFSASGSHASYFQHAPDGHETSIQGSIVPVLKLKLRIHVESNRYDFVADETVYPPITPVVEVLPDPVGPAQPDDPAWRHAQWLKYPGAWGVREIGKIITGGPTGPAFKGLKWHHPFAWSEEECWPDYLVY